VCDTVNLLAMQHDGWVLAVTGRRQAYLLGTVPLPRILPTLARISSRSRHRAPVDKVKFSDGDSDVVACISFFSSAHAGLKMLRPRMLQDKRRTAHHNPGDTQDRKLI
jgi:hypothetical protein